MHTHSMPVSLMPRLTPASLWQGSWSARSRQKPPSTAAATARQLETARTVSSNPMEEGVRNSIQARHKQRSALATMDDVLNLYAREGPQEPSIFFCRGCAHHTGTAGATLRRVRCTLAPPCQQRACCMHLGSSPISSLSCWPVHGSLHAAHRHCAAQGWSPAAPEAGPCQRTEIPTRAWHPAAPPRTVYSGGAAQAKQSAAGAGCPRRRGTRPTSWRCSAQHPQRGPSSW